MINFSTQYKSNISFKQLPFMTYCDKKIAKEYTVPIKINDGNDVFVKIEPDYVHNNFETKIQDINEENIATNYFVFHDDKKTIQTHEMNVWYRCNRGKNLGVIMHLNSIIELLENNYDKIELYSLAPAIFFHGKCKFEPVLTEINEARMAMYTIMNKDYKKFPEIEPIVKKALTIFPELHDSQLYKNKNCELVSCANEIVQEYIDVMTNKKLSEEEREEFGLDVGFNMVLTKEKILENKDFFNKLFKKFDIDYQI